MATAGRSSAPNLRFADRAVGHRKTPLVLSLLLASVVAAALIPQAAFAASGGVMGGRSSSYSSRSTGFSRRYSHHSSRTYVSVGTPMPPGVATDVDDEPDTVFLVMAVGVVLLFVAAMYYGRPRTTVWLSSRYTRFSQFSSSLYFPITVHAAHNLSNSMEVVTVSGCILLIISGCLAGLDETVSASLTECRLSPSVRINSC
jgi:hypothetical protein